MSRNEAVAYLRDCFGLVNIAEATAGTVRALEENILEDPRGHVLDIEAYRLVLEACPDVLADSTTENFIEEAAAVGVVL